MQKEHAQRTHVFLLRGDSVLTLVVPEERAKALQRSALRRGAPRRGGERPPYDPAIVVALADRAAVGREAAQGADAAHGNVVAMPAAVAWAEDSTYLREGAELLAAAPLLNERASECGVRAEDGDRGGT